MVLDEAMDTQDANEDADTAENGPDDEDEEAEKEDESMNEDDNESHDTLDLSEPAPKTKVCHGNQCKPCKTYDTETTLLP